MAPPSLITCLTYPALHPALAASLCEAASALTTLTTVYKMRHEAGEGASIAVEDSSFDPLHQLPLPLHRGVPGARSSGKEKTHIHINKFAGLSRDLVGGKHLFMCFFFRSFLMGEKKHTNKIPQKCRENPATVLFMCFFYAP